MVYHEKSKYLSETTATNYNKYLPEYFFFDYEEKKYVEETQLINQILDNQKFNSVLELGVGTGRITKLIGPRSKQYTGIDISPSMIENISTTLTDEKYSFKVQDINDFINENTNALNKYDFIGSFWAFNYAVLSFFEYTDPKTGKAHAFEDKNLCEENAKKQINKLFSNLNKGTEFLFFYFDAYSVEQSYVTRILEESLPFPYSDRGYTLKILVKTLKESKHVDFTMEHKNGFVHLDNETHLINYFATLHLKNKLNTKEEQKLLLNAFEVYRNKEGAYRIPAGMNVISGKVI